MVALKSAFWSVNTPFQARNSQIPPIAPNHEASAEKLKPDADTELLVTTVFVPVLLNTFTDAISK